MCSPIKERTINVALLDSFYLFTCMCSRVSLQIKGVVKPFSTESTEVPLGIAVALHVSVEESLQTKSFTAYSTGQLL